MTTTKSRNSQLEACIKAYRKFAIAVLFLSGGLVACSNRTEQSSSTKETTTSPSMSSSPNTAQSPSTTETTTSPSISSSPNSSSQTISDRDFLTMMTAHHKQAIEMANLAPTRAKRSEIKQLASSIIKDQQSEIQTMATLYKAAYGTEIPSMTVGSGMMSKDGNSTDRNGDQGMMQMPMNGMKMHTNALKNAADFDQEFLRQMTSHHERATQMSQMMLKATKSPEIQTLAQSIIKTQTAEVSQMQKWYQSWYKSNL
jgi:uncharacterized protein (DUF305 family)